MKARVFQNAESGFSLVGMIVILGFVLVIVTQVIFSRAELLKTSTKLHAADGYRHVLEGFTAYLGERLQGNFASLCLGQTSTLQGMDFSGAILNYSTALSVPSTLLASEPELVRRCQNPRFNQTGRQYFCLGVTKSPNLPAQSFAGSEYGYVEVAVRPVDVWQREINCAAFSAAAPGQAGLQIYYRAYWADSPRVNGLNERAGYYYAVKQ